MKKKVSVFLQSKAFFGLDQIKEILMVGAKGKKPQENFRQLKRGLAELRGHHTALEERILHFLFCLASPDFYFVYQGFGHA